MRRGRERGETRDGQDKGEQQASHRLVTIAAGSWVHNAGMHLGLHLPQLDLDGSGLSLSRLTGAARAARDAGFGSLGANDQCCSAGPGWTG